MTRGGSQQRRAHKRVVPASRLAIHWVDDVQGAISFDGQVIDIGAGGLGVLAHTPGTLLEPGAVLKGCRIELPSGRTLTVDLEVRYSLLVTLGDGTSAKRSGCAFVGTSPELDTLIAVGSRERS